MSAIDALLDDWEAELIAHPETTDEQMWLLFSDDQRDDAEQDEIAKIVL
jgi:hypothetical protein